MTTSYYVPEWVKGFSDKELVDMFKGGNEEVFAEIVMRHRDFLKIVSFRYLRNETTASEVVQDAFLRAYRGLKNFRGDSSLKTWLTMIVSNLARNRYWHDHRRKKHLTLSLDSTIEDDSEFTIQDMISDQATSPREEIAIEELEKLVDKCLGRLSSDHREILHLRIREHRTYEEISAQLGVIQGTVKSRIARARIQLLSQMGEVCPEILKSRDLSSFLYSRPENGLLRPK